MINYKEYINKEIINQNDEVGTVLSFDQDRISIKYPKCEKSYSSEISIKSGFITFKDPFLNESAKLEFKALEEGRMNKAKESAKQSEEFLAKVREINQAHIKLLNKYHVLCSLFGSDFKYSPLAEFEKKHQQILDKRNKNPLLRMFYRHRLSDDYIFDPYWF